VERRLRSGCRPRRELSAFSHKSRIEGTPVSVLLTSSLASSLEDRAEKRRDAGCPVGEDMDTAFWLLRSFPNSRSTDWRRPPNVYLSSESLCHPRSRLPGAWLSIGPKHSAGPPGAWLHRSSPIRKRSGSSTDAPTAREWVDARRHWLDAFPVTRQDQPVAVGEQRARRSACPLRWPEGPRIRRIAAHAWSIAISPPLGYKDRLN